MMKQIMKRAWEIAKDGVKKFGGKVREYFASSLSIAWEETKKTFKVEEFKLVGSHQGAPLLAVPTSLNLRVIDGLYNVIKPLKVAVNPNNNVEYEIYRILTDGKYGEFHTSGDGYFRDFNISLANAKIYYNGGTKQC